VSWRRFIFRNWWDAERRRELESYIEIETDVNIARGMTPADARRAARARLGNPTLIREDIYRMNTLRVVESFWHDLRYGARLLRLNPGFTVVALLSLTLGVGANAAIAQLLDAVRLRPLPVERPEELVEVVMPSSRGRAGSFTGRRPVLTNDLWEHIRDSQQVFAGMAAWATGRFDLSAGGEARYAQGLYVSGGFFDTLGVRPIAGRLLSAADDVRGCGAPGAVLSHAFWQREFGGQPVLGRTVRLDGRTFEVAGVTEPSFFGVDVGRSFDVALPLCAEALLLGETGLLDKADGWFIAALGRLRPGVSAAEATAHLQAISPAIFRSTLPSTYTQETTERYLQLALAARSAPSGVSSLRGAYETPLWALLGTTGLVLLIACANLANLMLARATAREREIAVRLAIGASRRRVIRQLMSESLLLAAAGAACGAVLAQWLSGFLVAFLDTSSSRVYLDLGLDWRLFGLASVLAVGTCLLFGLAPALRVTRAAPVSAMRTGSRSVTDGHERFGLRRLLVVVQVALSLVLMVAALLFARSLTNLRGADLGFHTEGLIVASLDLRRAQVPEDRLVPYAQDVTDRLARVPSVAGAAQAAIVPVSGSGWNQRIVVDGKTADAIPHLNRVSPGYFAVIGTPVVAGRDFSSADSTGGPEVAIVSEAFARRFFGSPSVLGRTFQIEEGPDRSRPHYQVVGVVADTKYSSLRSDAGPIAYFPAAHETRPEPYVQLLLRARGAVPPALAEIRRTVAEVNPSIGVELETMDGQIRDVLLPERLMATLSAFFGGLAAVIAMVGLYGVMSYTVARRRNEIGIRMALGADRAAVIRMVLREGAILVTVGTCAGLVLSVLASMGVQTLLFGLQPGDPVTLGVSALALMIVALSASWLPAMRAASVSPVTALREQ
jgi:predicted permease